MIFLSREDILNLHSNLLKETNSIKSVLNEHVLLMLETQISQSIGGKELYPGVFLKAAFYARTISGEHVFMDGNKRTSLAAVNKFLNNNGYILEAEEGKELEDFVLDVAQNRLSLEAIAFWIEKHSQPKE